MVGHGLRVTPQQLTDDDAAYPQIMGSVAKFPSDLNEIVESCRAPDRWNVYIMVLGHLGQEGHAGDVSSHDFTRLHANEAMRVRSKMILMMRKLTCGTSLPPVHIWRIK